MAKCKYTRFKKPAPEEVSAYGLTLGYPIDGEEFCDFYESKGWKIGTSPMKSWQACVRTWKRGWIKRTGRDKAPIERQVAKTADQIQKEIEAERWKQH